MSSVQSNGYEFHSSDARKLNRWLTFCNGVSDILTVSYEADTMLTINIRILSAAWNWEKKIALEKMYWLSKYLLKLPTWK